MSRRADLSSAGQLRLLDGPHQADPPRRPRYVHVLTADEQAAFARSQAIIFQSNGMLAVGQSIPHACVQALFLEETAQVQLLAQAAGLTPRFYSAADAARRHGDDRVHEPLRAWEYYVAMAEGKLGR